MELLDAFNGWGFFFIVFGIILVIGLIIGGIGSLVEGDGEPLAVGAVIGGILGVVFSLLITLGAYDTWEINSKETFEATYQVSIVEGTVPLHPNDRTSVLMYTSDGGPVACIVSTDDVEYTVVCDGEELRPVNVK